MSEVRSIAFYLPQFHPVNENDAWWGKGFTEWRNVVKARPQFPGHYQPHIPADLGFYDLRLPELREAQAEMAREFGIQGFCYYHYWFNGRRILERPFNEVLESGKPEFPFCLCWANENWTRVWDGGDKHILLEQKYNNNDDLAHIRSLFPAFRDERYIRVNGKPLFLIYRAELLPDPARTIEIWRQAALDAGIGDLYLARVESYESVRDQVGAPSMGFDADVEFAPFSWNIGSRKFNTRIHRTLSEMGLFPRGYIENRVIEYDRMVRGMLSRADVGWTRFPCVTPSWDNSARRKNASIFVGSTPEKYEAWLREVVAKLRRRNSGDEGIVFVNAWNEWAEGNHLEPDLKWGRAYLEATKRGLRGLEKVGSTRYDSVHVSLDMPATKLQKAYWRVRQYLRRLLGL